MLQKWQMEGIVINTYNEEGPVKLSRLYVTAFCEKKTAALCIYIFAVIDAWFVSHG